jgi:hypothetical protein
VQQLVTGSRQLIGRALNVLGVLHLEFDRELRDRPRRWPLGRADTSLGGLRQRPQSEMFGALNSLAEKILVAFVALQGQAQNAPEERSIWLGIADHDPDAGNEENVHSEAPRSALTYAVATRLAVLEKRVGSLNGESHLGRLIVEVGLVAVCP